MKNIFEYNFENKLIDYRKISWAAKTFTPVNKNKISYNLLYGKWKIKGIECKRDVRENKLSIIL